LLALVTEGLPLALAEIDAQKLVERRRPRSSTSRPGRRKSWPSRGRHSTP
jgi:hypothetical protein